MENIIIKLPVKSISSVPQTEKLNLVIEWLEQCYNQTIEPKQLNIGGVKFNCYVIFINKKKHHLKITFTNSNVIFTRGLLTPILIRFKFKNYKER